jgi:hypothetical protein
LVDLVGTDAAVVALSACFAASARPREAEGHDDLNDSEIMASL